MLTCYIIWATMKLHVVSELSIFFAICIYVVWNKISSFWFRLKVFSTYSLGLYISYVINDISHKAFAKFISELTVSWFMDVYKISRSCMQIWQWTLVVPEILQNLYCHHGHINIISMYYGYKKNDLHIKTMLSRDSPSIN